MGTIRGPSAPSVDHGEVTVSAGSDDQGKVLVPLRNGTVQWRTLELGRRIAAGFDLDLVVLNAVRVARAAPLTLPIPMLEGHRETTLDVVEAIGVMTGGLPVTGAVHVGHDLPQIVEQGVESYGAEVVVVDESWLRTGPAPLARSPLDELRAAVDCPVAVPSGAPLPDPISTMLVPVARGVHSAAATRIAQAVANATGAWIDLLSVVTADDPEAKRDAERELEARARRTRTVEHVGTWLLEADSVEDAIVEQSQYYELTVIGGTRTPRLRRALLGSTAGTVRTDATNCVVTAWGSGFGD